jgi:type I restriction enzyme S subunit
LVISDDFFAHGMQYAKGAKMPRGDKNSIMKFKIPLPYVAEQNYVINTLDHFETLINNLTNGLPAEITARRKQYEYYRDKLLMLKGVT